MQEDVAAWARTLECLDESEASARRRAEILQEIKSKYTLERLVSETCAGHNEHLYKVLLEVSRELPFELLLRGGCSMGLPEELCEACLRRSVGKLGEQEARELLQNDPRLATIKAAIVAASLQQRIGMASLLGAIATKSVGLVPDTAPRVVENFLETFDEHSGASEQMHLLDVCVNIAKLGPVAATGAVDAGVIDALLDGVENEADLLVQLNCVELMTAVSTASVHAARALLSDEALECMFKLISNNDSIGMGLLLVLAQSMHRAGSDDDAQAATRLIAGLESKVQSQNNTENRLLLLEALRVTSAALPAQVAQSPVLSGFAGAIVCAGAGVVREQDRARALDVVSDMLKSCPPTSSMALLEGIGGMERLVVLAKSSSEDLRQACLAVIASLSSLPDPSFLRRIFCTPGCEDILLERTRDRDAKARCLATILGHPQAEEVLGVDRVQRLAHAKNDF